METWITFTGLTFAGLIAAQFSAALTTDRAAPPPDTSASLPPRWQPIDHRARLIEEGGG